ncbi:MAG: CPBP family intramembrane metalloprotease, partial [archaeon]|nr:CPBP family intramembrane metalloprotease [archaeon]
MNDIQLINKKSLFLFILISFVFSWSFFILFDYILIPQSVLVGNIDQALLYLFISHYTAMLGPGIASIIMIKFYHKEPLPSWNWSKLKNYLYSAIFMIAIWGIPTLIGFFIDLRFDIKEISPVQMLFIVGSFTLLWVSGMGEEMGWCVYLMARLAPKTGKLRAMVISGIIRGIWHLPVLLTSYIIYSELSIFIILFLAITFSMQLAISNIYFGFIFGWIWFETKSLPLLGWMHQLYDMIRD